MGLPQERQAFHGVTDTVPQADKAGLVVMGATALKAFQMVVKAVGTAGTGNYNITLPPLAEAMGRFFSLYGTISGGAVVTLRAAGDDESFDDVVVANGQKLILYSDGLSWTTIFDSSAAAD